MSLIMYACAALPGLAHTPPRLQSNIACCMQLRCKVALPKHHPSLKLTARAQKDAQTGGGQCRLQSGSGLTVDSCRTVSWAQLLAWSTAKGQQAASCQEARPKLARPWQSDMVHDAATPLNRQPMHVLRHEPGVMCYS